MEGLTGVAGVRYRDGLNVNNFVGASSTFNPSTYQSGKQWRPMPFFLTYTTPELFGMEDFLTLSGGWANPYDIFAQQRESKFFRNNAIISSKGISANDVGWSSGYVAWGGYMKIKPARWYYAQAGIFRAIPNANNTANHGLDFQGARPADRNGFYFISETGVTPQIGRLELPGKYVFGGYYSGLENTSFFGQPVDGKFGFYWQADQMLWREPSPEIVDRKREDAKTFTAVELLKSKVNDQGLRWFSFFNFAPAYNNAMPFYFHTGIIYEGLIPGRDQDQAGVAFALGNYSYNKILADYSAGRTVHQTYESVLEFDYRIELNSWAFISHSFNI